MINLPVNKPANKVLYALVNIVRDSKENTKLLISLRTLRY
jgi:hypothetical protein